MNLLPVSNGVAAGTPPDHRVIVVAPACRLERGRGVDSSKRGREGEGVLVSGIS
jgi:hypothetical protein